jgi:hypothetical protein
MSRTISSSTSGPVVLATTDNPLYITSTGTVTSTGAADGIDGGSSTTWTITNAGVVSASSGNGVSLAGAAAVSNTGSISGNDAVVLGAGGSVTNNVGGSISGLGALGAGLGSGAGVFIHGAAGTVTNRSTISGVAYGVGLGTGGLVTNTSVIKGGEDGVIIQGAIGTIANYGVITATVDDGASLFAGGSLTNASGASISALGATGAGVFVTGGVGTITNAGTITGAHHGVLMTNGGSFSNAASGVVSAPGAGIFAKNVALTVMNAGFIHGTGTGGTGVYLGSGGSVTNASTGIITGDQFGTFLEGGTTTLANYGSISGGTYDGAVLGLGGMVTNAAGASISGNSTAVYVERATGTVTNSGSIGASGTNGTGVDLGDGGTITNNSAGSITGTSFGVFVTGATGSVANTGSISSTKYGAVELGQGGNVTNTAGGSIKGGSTGVYILGAAGTVTNSGNINAASSSGAGVGLGAGGSVTNNAAGSISGGSFGVFATSAPATLSNSGSISGAHGVGFEVGGSITNVVSASISGQLAGVFAQGGVTTLTNTGSISASAGGAGADIEGGGSITNLTGATISGGAFGIFLTGGSGTVTNAGTISGGSYAIDFAGSGTNRLIVDPGAVFLGGVTGGSGTSTLELASGTGSISGVGTGSFNHFQVLAVDAGASWTLNGTDIAPTVVDDGTLVISGSLDVSTAIDASSTGVFQLGSGAALEVAAATGAATQFNFLSGPGELIVDNAALFGTNVGTASYTGPQLQDFSPGDEIDLKSFSSTGVTFNYNASTGVLQVSNGASQVASFEFQTSTIGGTSFAATSDGGNGIIITDPASVPSVTSIATSGAGITNGNGDLAAGKIVTFTVNFSSAVDVNTTNGAPTLVLNDGGTATYSSGSSTSALVFSYTAASGQNTPDLTVASLNLNGATIQGGGGNNADVSGATNDNPAGTLQIDTTPPAAPTNLSLDPSTDSGVQGDGTTDFTQVKIDGTAEPGSTVTLYDSNGTTVLGTGSADATTGAFGIITSVLASGTHNITATATDAAGNISAKSGVYAVTIDSVAPTVSSIVTSGTGITNGNGDLDAGKVVTLTVNFSSAVIVNTSGGTPTLALNDGGTATYTGGSGSSALTFSYTVLAGQNTADLVVSSLKLNGATVSDLAANNANLSGATNDNPAGTLQIDTTAPTIAINTIASNNIISATKAANGFSISGSTSGVENGQIVTVNILNSANTIVDTYTATDNRNAWSVAVTSAQATALADGSYTVTANVSDKAGNPSPTATHALTVDEDKTPEAPALTISNTSLTVAAGGSVALGITATPVDVDDRLRVQISGLPSYEVITAPSGDNVSRARQANGTYTWTITEASSAAGTPLTGLTLTSQYTGTGHPVATLTVTASNITSGETATSASTTLSVTDPPATTSIVSSSTPPPSEVTSLAPERLAALFTQYMAAGFSSDAPAAGLVPLATASRGGPGDEQFLVKPHS